ncbi:AI-2E family transporter [Desulfomicrobium sp. ZS1]|uniref:AI-2E family transporter n=1 Tax=Desulfomicrobium sp. ZS1 TaxID=2952228 RepID=UPI0020B20B15|nr:AI-2E family transporter [Desulfomicrobium sp. ZS1]UTF50955.1 AI-2E family transporter [Desulfomicrobium sp. ZS1]
MTPDCGQGPTNVAERIMPALIRILVWGGVFAVVFILRSFFLLLFLTFVFGYIQNRGVNRLQGLIPNRPLRVVLVASIFLGVLITVGVLLVPRAKDQTVLFVTQLPQYVERLDQELGALGERYPMIANAIPELGAFADHSAPGDGKSRVAALVQQIFGMGDPPDGQHKVNQLLDLVRGVGGRIAAIASAFLLALLFSFLIVLDLPRLSASVCSLENSKLGFVYREVAGSIRDFAMVLGKALEAQFVIALVNATLTAIGVSLLGLGSSMAFLTVIVFLCSFIPVLGVFISSVPICLIALQDSGLTTMMLGIVMITVIHLLEGYVLNPRIYGSYMRINPVIVLVILTVGAKLFHIWGLVLGVPICTYIFGHVIQHKEMVAAAPLSCPRDDDPE